MKSIRGIRGAINVRGNIPDDILDATRELLAKMIEQNNVEIDDIASIIFTATEDLTAEYPAYAARDMGLSMVPLLCSREMNVPGAMKKVIRILIHVNTNKKQHEIKHQYLRKAASLRPDISKGGGNGRRDNEN